MSDILNRLTQIIETRMQSDASTSYVAQLHEKGLNKILEKVGEECTEVILAAKDAEKDGDNTHLIYETADLWFHSLVMLAELGEDANAVLTELDRRFETSGLEEKANRN